MTNQELNAKDRAAHDLLALLRAGYVAGHIVSAVPDASFDVGSPIDPLMVRTAARSLSRHARTLELHDSRVRPGHDTQRLRTPQGEEVDIDVPMVPLLERLWANGYVTLGSCRARRNMCDDVRDEGPEMAWIEFSKRTEAICFCATLEAHTNATGKGCIYWVVLSPTGGNSSVFLMPYDIGVAIEALAPQNYWYRRDPG